MLKRRLFDHPLEFGARNAEWRKPREADWPKHHAREGMGVCIATAWRAWLAKIGKDEATYRPQFGRPVDRNESS
jgi:hypothetical protein